MMSWTTCRLACIDRTHVLATILAVCLTPWSVLAAAAPYHSTNFTVYADSSEVAQEVGEKAEFWRRELALEWLGKEMPNWFRPCPIKVKVGKLGAGGMTTFSFDRGEVFGWNMQVQGTLERVLDSVLPHEITHTILACHFRRPLPRWADEGACTLIEHESEKNRQLKLLGEVLEQGDRIPLRQLFSMTEYPKDMHNVMKLYAEGYSVADYLVQQGGPRKFLSFMEQAHQEDWDVALNTHYNIQTVEALEQYWAKWTIAGSPRLESVTEPAPVMLAQGEARSFRSETLAAKAESETSQSPQTIVRGQSPETSDAPVVDSSQISYEASNSTTSDVSISKPSRQQLMLPVLVRVGDE